VIGMTKSLGKELAGLDIAVNAITPAAARTRIFDQMKQEHIDYMLSKIPRARFLEVDEAANMVAAGVEGKQLYDGLRLRSVGRSGNLLNERGPQMKLVRYGKAGSRSRV
jgi:NAD(P)-dependent dehydrogenase (short-subunit alcohol dehydrogenase family)